MRSWVVRLVIGIVGAGAWSPAALGHFYMLLPSCGEGKRGQEVTVSLVLGHPYERDLVNAVRPAAATIRLPDGKQQSILEKLEKAGAPCPVTGKAMDIFQTKFVAGGRGDYILTADSSGHVEGQEIRQDHAKTIVHVQSQSQWDAECGQLMEWIPLTRPYGLEAGFVFQARLIRRDGGPVAGVEVEIEQYLAHAPKEEDLPPDEMVTRIAKTDPNGVITFTLDEPGWWLICGTSESPVRLRHEGAELKTIRRAILMVHVGERYVQKLRP